MKELFYVLLILLHDLHGIRGEGTVDPSSKTGEELHAAEDQEASRIEKRSVKDAFSRRSGIDKNFIRFGRSGTYFHEPPSSKEKNLVSYNRVRRAMRFRLGLIAAAQVPKALKWWPIRSSTKMEPNENLASPRNYGFDISPFMRYGRGKDNFMRFGRAKDNFMRFGRAKDNFLRFGRAKDNFLRFGRAKDNFLRFGRAKDNFLRFGRQMKTSDLSTTPILDGQPKYENDMIRYERKDPDNTPDDQRIDDDGSEIDGGDLDLQADKPKEGPINRIKREAQANTLWDVEEDRARRDAEILDQIGQEDNKNPDLQKRFVSQGSYYDLEPGWIVVDDSLPDYETPEVFLPEEKRGGERNFIRFG